MPAEPEPNKRVFLALDIPDGWKEQMGKYQNILKENYPQMRLTPSRNFHLTLAYYGFIDSNQLQSIMDHVDLIVRDLKSFVIEPLEPSFFNYRKRIIFWYGVSSDELTDIAQKARRLLTDDGQPPFNAHVTLGRLNNHQKKPVLPAIKLDIQSFRTTELVLYESVNDPAGPLYLPLKKWALI